MDPSSGLMRLAECEGENTVFRPVVLSSTPAPAPQRTAMATATAAAYTATAPRGGGGGAVLVGSGESSRRKRGRPRKYGPDGSMVLAMMPASQPVMVPSPAVVLPGGPAVAAAAAIPPLSSGVPVSPAGVSPLSGRTQVSTAVLPPSSGCMPVLPAVVAPLSGNGGFPSVVLTTKRGRGRPVGSGNKQQQLAGTGLDSPLLGLKPYILTVKTGEDLSGKIMSFPQHGLKGMCILSANGSISNVTLRQSSTSGGTVTYEGRFEILSLSGSYLLSESGGQRSRTGGLSVSLAGTDGRIFGGGVAGLLIAASPIQVVIGGFNLDGEDELKSTNPSDPFAPLKISHGGAPASPPSRGTLNDSSGSPPNQDTGNYNNSPLQGMVHMLWK